MLVPLRIRLATSGSNAVVTMLSTIFGRRQEADALVRLQVSIFRKGTFTTISLCEAERVMPPHRMVFMQNLSPPFPLQ
jgi:hypothetical protein